MEQRNEANIISKPAFQAVGLKWEGTFAGAQAGEIRAVIKELRGRLSEIQHKVNSEKLLGLSYNVGKTGFIHYAAVEVSEAEQVPAGMSHISVPALTYAMCEHSKEQNIDRSYKNLFAWIQEQGYSRYQGEGLMHFEDYPMKQDPYDTSPEFKILIPVSGYTG